MTASDRYAVPARRVSVELEIKRSRFIATVDLVDDVRGFQRLLAVESLRFADAGHHCWAYVAGPPGDMRYADKSDDGEPRGTAGGPMLNVLQHSGLGHVGAVVTRYFGGIKLGAGGLVRAYGGSVSAALDELPRRQKFVVDVRTLSVPYPVLASTEHWLASTDIEVAEKRFAEQVTLILRVPRSQVAEAAAALSALLQRDIDWTAGDGGPVASRPR